MPDEHSAIILKPSEESFDFPAALVTPQRPSVLGLLLTVPAVGSDHRHAILVFEPGVQFVGVVCFVADEVPWVIDGEF